MTIRSYSTFDYGARVTSPRSASVPPLTTVNYARQQTPGPQQGGSSRRRSSTMSVTALPLSSRSPAVGLSSRLSGSVSTLPVGRGSRSSVKLIIDADDEARGSSYSTKPLSSFQRASHPLRQSYKGGKMRGRYSYLDDIEEEDQASHMSDLRMRALRAKECFDEHRQVLDRLRRLQMNGPTPVASVSPLTSSLPSVTSTSSVRHENTRSYLPMRTPPVTVMRSETTASPARRLPVLRELLSRAGISRRRYR